MADFTEPCILVQDDKTSQPLILLRRDEGAEVETLTIQQAHELVESTPYSEEGPDDWWWAALVDLLEGIR